MNTSSQAQVAIAQLFNFSLCEHQGSICCLLADVNICLACTGEP